MKHHFITRCSAVIVLLLSLIIQVSANDADYRSDLDNVELMNSRIELLGSSIDLKYNAKVEKKLESYLINTERSSEIFSKILIFFPLIEKVLNDNNLPSDLKIVSIIESGLDPKVRSSVGAVGLWQLMKPTAIENGLIVNSKVDQRVDPFLSTQAAAQYFGRIHSRFDDWGLALAAYNCGPGRVNRLLKKYEGRSLWDIYDHLPKETQNYIACFTAVSYLMNYGHEYGIEFQYPDDRMIYTSGVNVSEDLPIDKIVSWTSIPDSILFELNPAIKNETFNGSTGSYLILPNNYMSVFVQHYAFDYGDVLTPVVFQERDLPEVNTDSEKKEEQPRLNIIVEELPPLRRSKVSTQAKEKASFEKVLVSEASQNEQGNIFRRFQSITKRIGL